LYLAEGILQSTPQSNGQRRVADLERFSAQVYAVQLQQVEGIEENDRLVAAAAQDVEPGEPALVAAHHLPVDQPGPHLEVVSTIGFRGDSAIGRHQPDADRNSPDEAPSLRNGSDGSLRGRSRKVGSRQEP